MTEIKEIQISTIGEPAQVKIERGMKGGYGYEINIHAETLEKAYLECVLIKDRLNLELFNEQPPKPMQERE